MARLGLILPEQQERRVTDRGQAWGHAEAPGNESPYHLLFVDQPLRRILSKSEREIILSRKQPFILGVEAGQVIRAPILRNPERNQQLIDLAPVSSGTESWVTCSRAPPVQL